MAIDTMEKRRQALDFAKIRGTGMPNPPAGLVPAAARAHILNLYYLTPVIPPTVYFWRNKNLIVGSWRSKTAPSSTWSTKKSPATTWVGKVSPQDGTTQEI